MFVFKKSISRREMLRGAGAAVALPMLDSMMPAFSARAATTALVNRFGVVYVPNGMIMENYLPAKEGRDYEITPTLGALQSFREHFQILSGLNCTPTPGRPGGAHAKASTRFLTDISPPTSETWLDAGISVDQLLAQELGKQTQIASLELGIESGETAGSCDTGYACPYTNTLSWTGPSTPLPTQNDPRLVFERLFSDTRSTNPKERAMRAQEQKSLLDSVNAEAARLGRTLPTADRTKLSEYLEAVRGVERRIEIAEHQNRALPEVERPAGIPGDWEEHLKLMFDLMALAFQADITRVITFSMDREASMRTYTNLGISEGFHPLSHHGNNPQKMDKLVQIQNYHAQVFSAFIKKIEAAKEADGTVLDHSTILFGSDMSNSDRHNNDPLPSAILGHANGKIKGGQHLKYPQDSRHGDLLFTLLERNDIPVKAIGDSTQGLSEV